MADIELGANKSMPKGEGQIDQLPRFNVRLTSHQLNRIAAAWVTLPLHARQPGDRELFAALGILANGNPTPETVADVTMAPEVTFTRIGGESGEPL